MGYGRSDEPSQPQVAGVTTETESEPSNAIEVFGRPCR
ncbi:hypothetical protein FTUN_8463 [Frigoriglobus tundricola]|uniref:Uncharacterized protein n=1 Tax=Frigoriglobus tundricola TaxID=2774151 RepID=A0A6M5Z538_9BACT|nr:hypothetical protein FTUN_8463 [Frigoriglobus tundricola]